MVTFTSLSTYRIGTKHNSSFVDVTSFVGVIDKVRTPLFGVGGVVQLKAFWSYGREGWKSSYKPTYVMIFFQALLQNGNKIKWAIQIAKMIHLHLLRTAKKRKLDRRAFLKVLIRHFLDSFVQQFLYFVTFVVLCMIVIHKIYPCHIFLKK